MPETLAAMIVMVTLATMFGVVVIIKMILNYLKEKNRPGSSDMTTSQLSELIRTAVEDAVAPIEAKVDRMERQLRQPPSPSEEPTVQAMLDAPEKRKTEV